MSEKQITIPNSEAREKIKAQFEKGDELWKLGAKIIDANSGCKIPTSDRDYFESQYQQWEKIACATLGEIYVSGSYAYDFQNKQSSKVEYVSSDWVPDIRYFIDKLIRPKLHYLHTLLDNIDEYEEIEHKEVPHASQHSIESNLELPQKVTLIWLVKNVSATFWLWVIGLIVGAFLFGIKLGQIEWIQKLFGG